MFSTNSLITAIYLICPAQGPIDQNCQEYFAPVWFDSMEECAEMVERVIDRVPEMKSATCLNWVDYEIRRGEQL